MMNYDVMVAGHLCLDITPGLADPGTSEISDILSPGKLVHAEKPQFSTGGAVSNTGIAMKKLGNRVCFAARLGEDDFGHLTLKCLQQNGDIQGIKLSSRSSSSYSIVIAFPKIDRIFLHSPGSNDEFSADDIDRELLKSCRLFHFGYPPLMRNMYENEGEELLKIFKLAKDSGAVTSCDMALPDPESPAGKAPWKTILERALPYIDIFLPSVEEAFYMFFPERFADMKRSNRNSDLLEILDYGTYTELSDIILANGVKMTALKCGKQGWYFRTAARAALADSGVESFVNIDNWSQREIWIPSYKENIIKSATGAGDCSIAGFLTAFLKGLPIEDALKAASCLGWQNLRSLDALSGIGDWHETVSLLEILTFNPILQNELLRFDEKSNLYFGRNDLTENAGKKQNCV